MRKNERSRLLQAAVAAVIVILSSSGPLWGQTPGEGPCNVELARQLDDSFDEVLVAYGIQSTGHLVQVYASDETGTWTIVRMAPGGRSCTAEAGKGWESVQPPPAQGTPTAWFGQ